MADNRNFRRKFGSIPGQGELFSMPQRPEEVPGQGSLFDYVPTVGSLPTAPEAAEFEAISINEPDEDPENALGVGANDPAPLTIVPTSTTNPRRPRTVAAGYNRATKTMTVVFRDGTWWNYRGVPVTLWQNFKQAYSKGWFLHRSGLDTWADMGPVSPSALSFAERQALQIRAQIHQNANEGLQAGQRAQTMGSLKRADARIKGKGLTVQPHQPGKTGTISNPYIERAKRRR